MGFKPGESFDRYVIEAPLGQGGMGEVYRAYDPRLRRKIALKVLRVDDTGDPNASHGASERLLREARAAAALDHPNAVSVFDVGEVDGTPYIAMELVQGLPLRDYIGDTGVSYERRVRWLIDVARALAAAHDRGLVHRDVKPENVMVRDDGVIKVLDFGIAKEMKLDVEPLGTGGAGSAEGTAHTLKVTTETVKGALIGTPRYFAPEQVAGDPLDGRTDQFAWGVMAYELLHGRPPWMEDKGVMNMLLAITTHNPPSLSRVVASIPAVVSATVMRAMSKSPLQRFQKMSEVVSALEPIEANSRRSIPDISVGVATTRRDLSLEDLARIRSPVPPPRLREPVPRQGWLVAVTVIAATAIASAAALRTETPSVAPRPVPLTSATPPAAIAVTDQPPPQSASAEAIAAYRAAMQAFRDGTFQALRESLGRAVAIDPGLAAAHLRLAIFDSLVETDEPEAKKSYRRASQFRGTLNEHDQALLEALEPYFQRSPSNPRECEKRLRAAAEKYPDDAEMAFYVGWIRYDLGQLTSALAAFERAIALDPKFALAWSNKGGCQAYLGDFDGALKSLDECLAISPQATESLWYRTIIFEQEGACAREEEDARRWISKDAEDSFAYGALAKALYAEGRPREAVMAVLEQKWARITPEHRVRTELLDRAHMDLLAGDFDLAEKRAAELDRLVAGDPGATSHAEPARLLVEIYRETGRDPLARAIADGYVKRRDAWEPPNRVDDGAIESDPIPIMLGALAHTGGLDAATLDRRRQDWLNAWEGKTSEAFSHYLWVYAYAVPAETPEEARVALAALPKYAPVPPFLPQTLSVASVGQTSLLAGDLDGALPYLRKASASCMAMYRPIANTRAYAGLGDVLAKKSDRAGACAAYQIVLNRWGNERRSVTAQAVRARRVQIHCD